MTDQQPEPKSFEAELLLAVKMLQLEVEQTRRYLTIVGVIVLVGVVILALCAAGAITLEFKPVL